MESRKWRVALSFILCHLGRWPYLALLFIICHLSFSPARAQVAQSAVSPNGRITLERMGEGFSIQHEQRLMLEIPQIGIRTTSTNGELTFRNRSKARHIEERYDMISGKRRHCRNEANEYVYRFTDASGKTVRMVFRLYNDGVAFRY